MQFILCDILPSESGFGTQNNSWIVLRFLDTGAYDIQWLYLEWSRSSRSKEMLNGKPNMGWHTHFFIELHLGKKLVKWNHLPLLFAVVLNEVSSNIERDVKSNYSCTYTYKNIKFHEENCMKWNCATKFSYFYMEAGFRIKLMSTKKIKILG